MRLAREGRRRAEWGQEQTLLAPPQRPVRGKQGHSQVPSLEHNLHVSVVLPHHTCTQADSWSMLLKKHETRFYNVCLFPPTNICSPEIVRDVFVVLYPKIWKGGMIDGLTSNKNKAEKIGCDQPAIEFYKLINQNNSDNNTGCNSKSHRVCLCVCVDEACVSSRRWMSGWTVMRLLPTYYATLQCILL